MKNFRVACGQFFVKKGEKEKNISQMIDYAESAADNSCDLILFPELSLTGIIPPKELKKMAEPLDGINIRKLVKISEEKKIAIAFGFAEFCYDSKNYFNSMVIINKKEGIVGVYRKMHLWDTDKDWAHKGDSIITCKIEKTIISCWICYDTRFPEIGRLAALKGADLALVSTAWLGPRDEWELSLRGRAIDNSIFVAGADLIDEEMNCIGLSMIVDPFGKILKKAKPREEGILFTDLNAEDRIKQVKRLQLIESRCPENYKAIVKK